MSREDRMSPDKVAAEFKIDGKTLAERREAAERKLVKEMKR